MPAEKEYSEKIAAEIDDEVKRILEQAYAAAKGIIQEKRAMVEALAARLLEKEVVDREDFLRLVDAPA